MSDIVERLLDYSKDDHERGCAGRCYDCSCGYDDKRDPLMVEAADEITRLREWNREIAINARAYADEAAALRARVKELEEALDRAADRLFDGCLNDAWADARAALVHDLMPTDWDRGPYSLIGELKRLLASVVDSGTDIDSGATRNSAYLYAKIGGVEYRLTVVENRHTNTMGDGL